MLEEVICTNCSKNSEAPIGIKIVYHPRSHGEAEVEYGTLPFQDKRFMNLQT